jgi:hypothetical protein
MLDIRRDFVLQHRRMARRFFLNKNRLLPSTNHSSPTNFSGRSDQKLQW